MSSELTKWARNTSVRTMRNIHMEARSHNKLYLLRVLQDAYLWRTCKNVLTFHFTINSQLLSLGKFSTVAKLLGKNIPNQFTPANTLWNEKILSATRAWLPRPLKY